MRVLFLTGAYHPYYSANGLCMKNVVDECVGRGWDVTCLVNSTRDYASAEKIDGALVARVRPRLVIRWQQYANSHKTKVIGIVDKCVRLANKGKLFLRSRSWPQVSKSYTNRFYRAACALHDENPFDVVVAAYTPIDTLLAGAQLKQRYPDITFIPYYLDALAGGWGPSNWKKETIEKKTRRYEEAVDNLADVIVSMGSSRRYHEAFPLSEGINEKRFYLGVPIMKEQARKETQSKCHKKPYVLFAGSIPFPRRDPRPVLDLLSPVCKSMDIDFLIAGECSDPSIFDSYIKDSDEHIIYLGWKDKETIGALESDALALVNIGSSNASTIPCKIFEYMGHLKPIISTFGIDDEPSIPFLEEYGHGFLFDERVPVEPGVIDAACVFLSRYECDEVPADACRSRFYRNRPEAFADLLEKIFEGRSNA